MHGSFEAWLRAFDIKLQLHMLQSMLHVLHMPKVKIYTQHIHQPLKRFIKNNDDSELGDEEKLKFSPHMLPSSSTGGRPVTLDWLPKCTNHLNFQSNEYLILLLTETAQNNHHHN